MSEAPQAPTTPPAPNTPEARNPDGSLKEPTTQTPETKPSTDPAATPEAKPETKPVAGAPEKYADFKAPEGYNLSPEILTEATPIFKELNLTQEQAQKLVDFHSKQMLAAAEAPQQAVIDMRNGWKDQLKSDPEIGSKLDTVKANIGRAIDSLPQDLRQPFREAMDLTGAGDHPAFVKAFNKMAELLIEGKHVGGDPPKPQQQKSLAQAMYPGLASNS